MCQFKEMKILYVFLIYCKIISISCLQCYTTYGERWDIDDFENIDVNFLNVTECRKQHDVCCQRLERFIVEGKTVSNKQFGNRH